MRKKKRGGGSEERLRSDEEKKTASVERSIYLLLANRDPGLVRMGTLCRCPVPRARPEGEAKGNKKKVGMKVIGVAGPIL